MSHAFEVLGLEPAFDLEPSTIERAYLVKATTTQDEHQSSLLNDARSVLLNAESRANELHAVLAGPSADQDRSLPDGLLIEFMEARQAAEEAEAQNDREELGRWLAWAQSKRAGHIERLNGLFKAATPEALVEARLELNAWRYAERMIDQVGNVLDDEG